MSAALSTLDGLENGTDIGIQNNATQRVDRWTFSEGCLVRDGVALTPEMFSGYLSAGRVYLADFSPPQAGEWFWMADNDAWHYLVVEVKGSVAHTMQFRHGAYYQFQERHDLVDRFTRCPTPEWATGLVTTLGQMLWEKQQQVDRLQTVSRQVMNLQDNLRYITNYAERATNTLREMRP